MKNPTALVSLWTVLLFAASPAFAGPTASLQWGFERDEIGRIKRMVEPGGKETVFAYEFFPGEPSRIKTLTRRFKNGEVLCDLDLRGKRTAMKDGAGAVRYEWDDLGQLASVQRQGGPKLEYRYDSLGRLKSYSLGAELAVEYQYDFLGRVAAMKTPAGEIKYEYQTGLGKVVRTLPNGVRTEWAYTPNGKLESITHVDAKDSVLARFNYTYRADGLIGQATEWSPAGERQFTCGYDSVQRLVSRTDSAGGNWQAEYDAMGNLTKAGFVGDVSWEARIDWAGRLTSVNGELCEHDASGNLIRVPLAGALRQFEYDHDNRLQRVNSDDVAYAYDGDGNLIARTAGGTRTTFFPDPLSEAWRPLLATTAEGKPRLYLWEGAIPLAMVEGGNATFFLHDHLGSVRCVVDQSGGVVERRDYAAFGACAQLRADSPFMPGFAGLFWDGATSVYLTRNRAYSPELGRFLQIDPQHRVPSGSQKDLSIYAYCGGDPVNFVDHTGAEPKSSDQWWRPLIPDFSVGHTIGGFGESQTFLEPDYQGGFFTENRPTYSPTTLFGVGAQLSWGAQPGPTDKIVSADYGLGKYLGVSVNAFRTSTGEFKKGFSLNVGVAWPPVDFGGTITLAATTGPVYHGAPHFPQDTELWADTRPVTQIRSRNESDDLNAGLSDIKLNLNQFLQKDLSDSPWSRRPIFPPDDHGGGGGAAGGSSLDPSTVGGVYLGGAGKSLDGIGQLRGLALDEATGRLTLVADSGQESALPPLRLDDVVSIFRSVYELGEAPTVTIDPDQHDPYGPLMHVIHGKGTEGTYVGWVLFETDRIMKGYGASVDNVTRQPITSQIAGYPELVDTIFFSNDATDPRHGGIWERFWIVPAQVRSFQASARQLTLFDVPLKVNTQKMVMKGGKLDDDPNGKSSRGAQAFTEWFTRNYDAIARECSLTPPPETGMTKPVPVFSELRRIALITALAEQLRDQGVPMPIWMRDYRTTSVSVSATTPSLGVEKSKPTGKGTVRASLFGGVNLAAATVDMRSFVAGTEPKGLSAEERKVVQQTLQLANDLAPAVRQATAQTPDLQTVPVKWQDSTYQVVNLPGADTRAFAPCRLAETDLVAPVQDAYTISVTRRFNSFFNPSGPWGSAWTLDLPELQKIKIPGERTAKSTTFSVAYELTSPLGNTQARFAKIEFVPQLGGKLLVPDKPCEIVALAEANEPLVKAAKTQLILRDGQCWDFDADGRLVATEQKPFLTMYARDDAGQIRQIVGYYGDAVRALINLGYDSQGRLATAQSESRAGKNSVSYTYNEDGRLQGVATTNGTTRYDYDRAWVAAISRSAKSGDGKTATPQVVRRFEYTPSGQLIAETTPEGGRRAYTVARSATEYRLSLAPDGKKSDESAVFDTHYRPLETNAADGTSTHWQYLADGAVKAQTTYPNKETVSVTWSGNKKHRTIETSEKLSAAEEFDANGRLTSFALNNRPVFKQQWLPNGWLKSIDYETHSVVPRYDEYKRITSILTVAPTKDDKYADWQETQLDSEGRVQSIKDSTGAETLVGYGPQGDVTSMATKRDGKNYGFNVKRSAQGRIDKIESSWGGADYRYNEAGSLDRITYARGPATSSAEFANGRITTLTQFDGAKVQFGYYDKGDSKDRLRLLQTPAIALAYSYARDGHIAQVDCGENQQVKYDFDPRGNLKTLTLASPN